MEEDLITFETAKLAKEKGFDIACWNFYDKGNEVESVMGFIGDSFEDKLEFAQQFVIFWIPAQAQLQKWLREKHKIRVFVHQGAAGNFKVDLFTYPVPNNKGDWKRSNNIQSYNTYEEALEEGLIQGLKLI